MIFWSFHLCKSGERKKCYSMKGFGDSKLNCAAELIRQSYLIQLWWSKDNCRLYFFLSPLLQIWADLHIKKLEKSCLRGIWNEYDSVCVTLSNHSLQVFEQILRFRPFCFLKATSLLSSSSSFSYSLDSSMYPSPVRKNYMGKLNFVLLSPKTSS